MMEGSCEECEGGGQFGGCWACQRLKPAQVMTPPRGEPMPQTIEHYKANALRDQELILALRRRIVASFIR